MHLIRSFAHLVAGLADFIYLCLSDLCVMDVKPPFCVCGADMSYSVAAF